MVETCIRSVGEEGRRSRAKKTNVRCTAIRKDKDEDRRSGGKNRVIEIWNVWGAGGGRDWQDTVGEKIQNCFVDPRIR